VSGRVLLLTHTQDELHTPPVLRHLNAMGQYPYRLNVDELASGDAAISFSAATAEPCRFTFHNKAFGVVSSDDVQSIWYRRPNTFNYHLKDKAQSSYAALELESFLEGLWLTISDRIWLNNPKAINHARRKTYQMEIARRVGFLVPATIITNVPDEARAFVRSCRNGAITKAIYNEIVETGSRQYTLSTTRVGEDQLGNLHLIRRLPAFFQEFIRKRFEVRLTVVGTSVFAMKIELDLPDNADHADWRPRPELYPKQQFSVFEPSGALKDKCLRMMNILDLSFGAFDFVCGRDSDALYFLELNPNGEWYGVEQETGLPISRAIAEFLATNLEERR